jgi:hypothetical protein
MVTAPDEQLAASERTKSATLHVFDGAIHG